MGALNDHDKYKMYRNVLNRIKLSEKKKYYNDLFKKIGKNGQLLWNVVNNLNHKANDNDKSPTVEILHNDEPITDQWKICHIFNEHFASVRNKVHNTIGPQIRILLIMLRRSAGIVNNLGLFNSTFTHNLIGPLLTAMYSPSIPQVKKWGIRNGQICNLKNLHRAI